MSRLVIFLDDGGVMSDNSLRGLQWRRLVSEFFTPLLGGTSVAWSEANRIVADRLLEPDAWQARIHSAADYESFDRAYQIDWLVGMCELVGVSTPSEEESFLLARRAVAYITRRVHAAFPGVIETIQMLHNQGYTLHTASGECSSDLTGYLHAMGVHHCFGRLYGPDLIDTFKEGPEYYERIFADLDISSANAVVVDDNPRAIHWATQVGARTVLVSNSPSSETGATMCISGLEELLAIIHQLD